MEIKTVGVVGAGQMGNGIAHVFALSGYDVALTDVSGSALEQALATIRKNMDRQATRGKISEGDRDAALERISTTLTLAELGSRDLIVEAASERETIKTAIFEDLGPHLGPQTILTSNTSSISITRLASRTDRPERFMGLPFMHPVPVMPLVALIPGIVTDAPTLKNMIGVVYRLGMKSALGDGFPALICTPLPLPHIHRSV